MNSSIPFIQFSNGEKFPILGLGTWKSKPGEVDEAIKYTIDIGYRHIDCAYLYGNEKEIGAVIAEKIAEGVIQRQDLYITSKLLNTHHRPEAVEFALKKTLADLNVTYLDLYLIHWSFGFKEDANLFLEENGKIIYSDYDYVDTWKGMEAVAKKDLTKSIGVSNFNRRQIERILKIATITPVNNQIECHPYLNQKQLIEFCKSKNITITAYSPLGSPDRPGAKPNDPKLLEDNKLKKIAIKYNKTTAQIVLKYQVQCGDISIPKSVTKSRIKENYDIFDFVLSEEDVAYIDTFDCNGRLCDVKRFADHPYYPFHDEF